jgi:hypothetical protein
MGGKGSGELVTVVAVDGVVLGLDLAIQNVELVLVVRLGPVVV